MLPLLDLEIQPDRGTGDSRRREVVVNRRRIRRRGTLEAVGVVLHADDDRRPGGDAICQVHRGGVAGLGDVAASFTQLELQANVPFTIPKGVLKVFPVIVWVTWKSCPAEVVVTVTQ